MLTDFLSPHNVNSKYNKTQIGSLVATHLDEFPDLEGKQLAIIGINDPDNPSANRIRRELYGLSVNPHIIDQIVDLGNIEGGNSPHDVEVALRVVLKTLRDKGLICMVIGGERELSYAVYASLEGVSNNVDVTMVSADLPIMEGEVLSRVCLHKPNYLFNINAMGFQSHMVPYQSLDIMNKLGFNQIRLGELKSKVDEAEPLIRNTNALIFDTSAIKYSDFPAHENAGPSGMNGDMACKLAYYAGVSDLTESISLFGMKVEYDIRNQGAKLIAQMLWYFMDGFANRVNDHPDKHTDFLRYRCNLDLKQPDIIFHKSNRTSRWWMEIPHPRSVSNTEMNVIVPCSYADYQTAAKGDLPERYLKTIQKMH